MSYRQNNDELNDIAQPVVGEFNDPSILKGGICYGTLTFVVFVLFLVAIAMYNKH